MSDATDPILDERARIARLVKLGLRTGYGLFGLTTVLFIIALFVGFHGYLTVSMTVLMFLGSFILAPAIVFSYGVKAANRADRNDSW